MDDGTTTGDVCNSSVGAVTARTTQKQDMAWYAHTATSCNSCAQANIYCSLPTEIWPGPRINVRLNAVNNFASKVMCLSSVKVFH